MVKKLKAKYIKSDIISTDDILPAKYKHMYTNNKILSKYLFLNKFPLLNKNLSKYQVLVSNGIFGIGSSREQAVDALLASGIKIIFSNNFGRIFYRNSWNLGLMLFQINTYNLRIHGSLFINIKGGFLNYKDKFFFFKPPSKFMLNIIKHQGIINYILKKNDL